MRLDLNKYRLREFVSPEFALTGGSAPQELLERVIGGFPTGTGGYFVSKDASLFTVYQLRGTGESLPPKAFFRKETIASGKPGSPVIVYVFAGPPALAIGRGGKNFEAQPRFDVFLAYDRKELVIDAIRSPWAFSFSDNYPRIRAEGLVSEIKQFLTEHASATVNAPLLAKLVKLLDDLIELNENEVIDDFLECMDAQHLQPVFLISILASTFIIKDKLKERAHFFTRAQGALRAIGLNEVEYLDGLGA
jgi:hypothetical protein